MKSKRETITGLKPSSFTSKNIRRLIINDARITPLPITPVKGLDNFFRNRPFKRNPIRGNNGTK
jgi:hypothetical protein